MCYKDFLRLTFILATAHALTESSTGEVVRPQLVKDALANNKDIYYFGLGKALFCIKISFILVVGHISHIYDLDTLFNVL